MSLLKQNTIIKSRVDENATKLNATNDKNREYKVEAIWNSIVYTRESESGHYPGLYYLIS